ncbi:amidase [Paeniglutamicibacter sulfureus]|uniref:amidase n=1 Tax=Paeniglutamicibacter sulfureus TaxID=43666 RepID=UPI002666E025|nr:amidase [Paeniglutamicibacter sulfureus]MDO2936476.1 amidase [Paeniglutamicibacter sulfureus]
MALPFSIHEASIEGVLRALDDGTVTAVELIAAHLARVGRFDRSTVCLNAMAMLNPNAFSEAAESDRRRSAGRGGSLEGVPFTVKDSYMVAGLTVAAGSPAFKDLVAKHDAFTVARIREAGGVLVGKTNMPPMADGGMQRGVYGRAESPYNADYLAAAYASGSSNGSGVATAASMGVFGMGEETVSSGRSPASNNGLCAYTPSRGVISIRGNWPLFPTRDVVVPHTRSMDDMFRLLDVIVADDPETTGDFWRHQKAVPLPAASAIRPGSYAELADPQALSGKRFGVPRMYLGQDPRFPVNPRPSVLELWDAARSRLEDLGATVVDVDFPLIEKYEGKTPGGEQLGALGILPEGWMEMEFNELLAHGWDTFLRENNDPALNRLADVEHLQIFPAPVGSLPDRYEEVEDYENRYRDVVKMAADGLPDPATLPGFPDGLKALEKLRKELFENWLAEHRLDGVVFPANADVGAADADTNPESADRAWENGVFFSNGNYALRHLGIPSVTVAMGLMQDTGMPVGLTFAGPAYSDNAIMGWGWAFEDAGTLRPVPSLAPELEGDRHRAAFRGRPGAQPPETSIQGRLDSGNRIGGTLRLLLEGEIRAAADAVIRLTVNGEPTTVMRTGSTWNATAILPAAGEPAATGSNPAGRILAVVHVVEGRGMAAGDFVEV